MLTRRTGAALLLWAIVICFAGALGVQRLHANQPPPTISRTLFNLKSTTPLKYTLSLLFRMGRHFYRIAPEVTDLDTPSEIDMKDAKFDDLLTALLSVGRDRKTPLTFRIENGVYVIEPKSAVGKRASIAFATTPGDKSVRSTYVIEDRPLGEALCSILDQTHERYMFGVPATNMKVTLHLKNATAPEAMEAALRDAEVLRHFEVVKDRGGYGLKLMDHELPLTANEFKSWKFSARFSNAPAWDAFNIGCAPLGNYQLDNNLQTEKVLITTSFQDRTFEQMISELTAGASSKIKIECKDLFLKARAL